MSTTAEPAKTAKDKEAERLKKIDFKMISFTLGGKDYGIDILKVKEIRKAGNFTKVPNTPAYVRGVDNLRGDIIPVIDLRAMFNLTAEAKEAAQENIIILRLETLILGIIVDTIEKVVGIASESIQPPHPIFGDINVRYISGVVQSEKRLYIILDVDRIFGQPEAEREREREPEPLAVSEVQAEPEEAPPGAEPSVPLDLQFVGETLAAFSQFQMTALNREWVSDRLTEWKQSRKKRGLDFQLTQKEEADEFLSDFASPHTGQIWPASATASLAESLAFDTGSIVVWNPGCGRGHESYSLALMLETKFSGKGFKIWASDNDLLSISTAPSLILEEKDLDPAWKSFTVQARNGLQFNSDLKARILFEFHDVNHPNPMPEVHLAVVRDLLSFLKPADQESVIVEITEKVRSGGYVVLGTHERLEHPEWKPVGSAAWSVYQKI